MSIIIWLFTFLLVLDCVVLMLLVLIQLPKKEAGMGQAFGGGATDALFGAGSGSALTKMTKYTAGAFFVLTLLISMIYGHQNRSKLADSRSILTAEDKLSLVAPAKPTNAATAAASTNAATNATPLLSTPKPVEKQK
jgi:preprotein translocase subunit SecG